MTTGNTMQIHPLISLQEANAREEFFKQRNLFLAQSHASAILKIDELNAQVIELKDRVKELEEALGLTPPSEAGETE